MNDAWKIDLETKDLCFDDNGLLETAKKPPELELFDSI